MKKTKQKHNALGSLMDCSVARQEWLLACLPTSTTYQHTPTAINPQQQGEGETGRGSLEQPSFYLHHTNCFIQEPR